MKRFDVRNMQAYIQGEKSAMESIAGLEEKLHVVIVWLQKHGGHDRLCDCADPCSCGWSKVKKALGWKA